MTEINDLVQEFWRTSSDGFVGASFFAAMRRLFEILERYFDVLEVCFDIIPIFADLADITLQSSADPNSFNYSAQLDLDEAEFRAKFKYLFDRCLIIPKISYCLYPKIWVTCLGSYLVS